MLGLPDEFDQLDNSGHHSGDDQTRDEEPDVSILRSGTGSRFKQQIFLLCPL